MRTFNYRLIIEGKVVSESEEDGQTLLAQSVQQFVQIVKPNKVEAHVIEGSLPILGEVEGEGVNVYNDLISKATEALAACLNNAADRLAQSLNGVLAPEAGHGVLRPPTPSGDGKKKTGAKITTGMDMPEPKSPSEVLEAEEQEL